MKSKVSSYATSGNHQELRTFLFKLRAYFKLYENSGGANGVKWDRISKEDLSFIRNKIVSNPQWTLQESHRLYDAIKPYEFKMKEYGLKIPEKPKSKYIPEYIKKDVLIYNGTEFILRLDGSSEKVKSLKALIGNRRHEGKTKSWYIPITESVGLKDFCLKWNVNVGQTAKNIIVDHESSFSQSYSCERVKLPLKFQNNFDLYDYQTVGADFAYKKERAMIADEMGLGKTPQAIAFCELSGKPPALIVCGKSLMYNWKKEIKQWTGKDSFICDSSKDGKETMKGLHRYIKYGMVEYVIMNYDGFKTHFCELFKKNKSNDGKTSIEIKINDRPDLFNTIVIDESHAFKDSKSQRFMIAEKVIKHFKYRLLLSGTPIVNKVQEIWPQIRLLGKEDDFGGELKFMRYFAKVNAKDFRQGNSKKKKDIPFESLNKSLRSSFMIRRQKHQVLKELPDKIRDVIELDIDNREEYNQALNSLRSYLIDKKGIEKADSAMRAKALVLMNVLSNISIRGKMKASVEFIKSIIANEKLVVFVWHLATIKELRKHFPTMLEVSGNVKDHEIQANVDKFQKEDKHRLIVITYQRGREGLTLTSASKWVALEMGWNAKDQDQAEDRVHRIGQSKGVVCYYLLGRNTIDWHKYNIISDKREVFNKSVDNEDTVKTSIQDALMTKLLKQAKNS